MAWEADAVAVADSRSGKQGCSISPGEMLMRFRRARDELRARIWAFAGAQRSGGLELVGYAEPPKP